MSSIAKPTRTSTLQQRIGDFLDNLKKGIIAFVLDVTAPAPTLSDARERQQARMICAFSFVFIPVIFTGIVTITLLGHAFDSTARQLFGALVVLVAVYMFSRTPRYRLAVSIMMYGLYISAFSVIYTTATAHAAILAALPIYVASIFRTTRRTILVGLLCVLIVVGIAHTVPGKWEDLSLSLLFIIASSVIVLSSASLLRATERQLTERSDQLLAKESLFRIALDNSQYGFMILQAQRDPDRAIRDFMVLEATRALIARSPLPASQIIGQTLARSLPPTLHQNALTICAQCLSVGKPLSGTFNISNIPGPAAKIFNFDYEVLPVSVDIVALNLIDVTERQMAEQQKLALAVERERVSMLQKFIGDASHDLMTPITILKTGLYLIKASPDQNKRVEQADRLTLQVDRLQHMLRDMITLSQLDQELEQVHESPTFDTLDISSFLATLAENYADVIVARGQVWQYLSMLPDHVRLWGDAARLNIALSNLLDNAIKYNLPGGTVTLRACLNPDDATHSLPNDSTNDSTQYNAQLVIEIQDSGRGFTTEDLQRIFERFYRGERHRPTTSGSGLGLSITRRIIEAHSGTVQAMNAPDGGALIQIALPCQLASDVPDVFAAPNALLPQPVPVQGVPVQPSV